ncbi:MAG: GNAT family N-acetyltransferase [Pseudomonadales bacterium]|nr:GNAT family N-acetyltransferase [Pseudomonadales bacterium]
MIIVERIDSGADLDTLVEEINTASWDEANGLAVYDAGALRAYLELDGTVFLACHELSDGARTLLGIASGRLEMKPYGGERWLYVDEVDVRIDQRRKGAGSALMNRMFATARAAGCTEVWLGTEVDNVAANALYRSLDPDEIAQVVGYTWALD